MCTVAQNESIEVGVSPLEMWRVSDIWEQK